MSQQGFLEAEVLLGELADDELDGLGGGFGDLLVDGSEGEDLALEILQTFPEVVVLGGEMPALDPQSLVVS